MSEQHTYGENVRNVGLGLSIAANADIQVGGFSASVDTIVARAKAILLNINSSTLSAANTVTLVLQDSDDDSVFVDVVDETNGPLTVQNSFWVLNVADITVESASLLLDDGTAGTAPAAGEIIVGEYKGEKRFFRIAALISGGSGTINYNAIAGLVALINLPNAQDIGDNS